MPSHNKGAHIRMQKAWSLLSLHSPFSIKENEHAVDDIRRVRSNVVVFLMETLL